MIAQLVKVYHLTIPEIGELTPRQVKDIYCHERNDDGQPVIRRKANKPGTLEHAIEQARIIARANGSDENKVIERVREKWMKTCKPD